MKSNHIALVHLCLSESNWTPNIFSFGGDFVVSEIKVGSDSDFFFFKVQVCIEKCKNLFFLFKVFFISLP